MADSTSQDRLREASKALFDTLGDRAMGAVEDKVGNLATKMETMASNGGLHLPSGGLKDKLEDGASAVKGTASKVKDAAPSPSGGASGLLKAASSVGSVAKGVGKVKDAIPGLGGSKGKGGGSEAKVTNIIEQIDVGVPIELAYNQWTEFGSFPSFLRKVENADAIEDNRVKWKAQILWSHREWESTILEQQPEERIVWKSEGAKGYVDGAVTFHEITPNLTRIIVVLEYHPQGLFERTGNIWRAQGRRVRAELQHFRRHVMAHTLLDPDSVEGWRGTIEDGDVVESHEDAQESEDERDEPEDQADDEGEDGDEPEDEYDDEPEDELDEDEDEADEDADDEPEDEYDDEADEDADDVDDEAEDEYDDEPEDELDEDEADEDDEDDEDEADEDVDEYEDDDTTDEIDDEYADEKRK